jgi:prepilin peptidase CpaA
MERLSVTAIAGGVGVSALIDLRTRRVPNALTLGIAAVGFALAVAEPNSSALIRAAAGFALGFALMLPGHIAGATGAGDVKLFAALGTLLGPEQTAVAFLYTAIAGGLVALAVAVGRRRLRNTVERAADLVRTAGANVGEIEHASADNRFAYAPAIAIGTLAAALGI